MNVTFKQEQVSN